MAVAGLLASSLGRANAQEELDWEFTEGPPDWVEFPEIPEIDTWLEPWNEPEGNGMDPDDWFQEVGQGLAEEIGLITALEEVWEENPEDVIGLGIIIGVGVIGADEAGLIDIEETLEGLGDIGLPEFTIIDFEPNESCTIGIGLGGGDINFEENVADPFLELQISNQFENGNSIDVGIGIGIPIDFEDGIEFEDPFDDPTLGLEFELNF